ncbi:hypothetical protein PQ459_10145 [Chryseobacterium sp. KACC 21268]|nr:hypothetical protein PQ459_10145 [Chryseobacterium sp. KACC 21268]
MESSDRDKDLDQIKKLAKKNNDDKLLKEVKKRKENSNVCKDGNKKI